ncbi:protein PATRONUS 2 isoform X2 [Olea europaea var. sylvestris]|uniref:Uncharacterized protein n=1 Tax=Olea europaea subsp. europaea TaxID=158383 RepID=A0A8S0S4Q2_OLEEU|nr:protein PATRONUS 2 isoform X2 [Olea europaea var. sylvestris]CAA2986719.1 Hypothetical predicted protein [Olea europaea subsp. europaea]
MEKPLTQKPLFIQDENSTIQRKMVHGKSRSSKPISEKGGAALESRRALNDITNKSFLHPEASLKKKNSQTKKHNVLEEGSLHNHVIEAEESSKTKSVNANLNIAEEGFLHDHNKCIEAEKASVERHFWDIVLPGHDSAGPVPRLAKIDPDFSSLAELKEINEDWLNSSSWWKSPPRSPTCWDSPPASPFAWEHESVEFTLKEEDDCHV